MASRRDNETGGPSLRLLRVGENLRHAISTVIQRGDIRHDDLSGVPVTVSEVRPSPDLRHATVYVMPLGGGDKEKVVKALNSSAAYIRGQIGKMVHMKYLPKPLFRLDESFEEATNIDAILRSDKVQRDLGGDED